MAETEEDRRDRLASLAMEWADRIRTEPVNGLAAELLDPLPRLDLYGLIGLLGGAANPNEPISRWWGWVRHGVTAMTADPIRWDTELEAADAAAEAERQPHPNQRKTAPDPIDARIAELSHLGLTARQVGAEVGLSRDAVSKRRNRLVRTGQVPDSPPSATARPVDPVTARIAGLAAEGRLDPEIAAEVGLKPAAVRARRRRAGIPSGAGRRLAAPAEAA